ncbi:MAG: hypothetical protein AAF525_13850 [Pseudomonadota bacterium]
MKTDKQRHFDFAAAMRGLWLPLALGLLIGCGEEDDSSISLAFASDGQDADPVVEDFPVAYVTRPVVIDDEGTEFGSPARTMNVFDPGASLIIKERASVSANETLLFDLLEIPEEERALYDIRDLEPDFSGDRLLFSLRGPFIEDADIEDQPPWDIWVYNHANVTAQRVITSETIATAGNDRDPHFLADGRIVFTSDRQRRARAILLDEGRPQFAAQDEDGDEGAFLLHAMDDDGTNIEQITFNQSHDQDPTVLSTGEIVFSRWDNVPGRDAISLYRIRPDGTQLSRLYGYHSQDSGRDDTEIVYLEPREMPDGRILALTREADSDQIAKDPLLIDVTNFVEHDQPIIGAGGTAQDSLIEGDISFGEIPPGGRYTSIWPLFDGSNRFLVSWSQCRLIEPEEGMAVEEESEEEEEEANVIQGMIVPCSEERLAMDPPLEAAPPIYSLWILDGGSGTLQPVVPPAEDILASEAVVLSPRNIPIHLVPETPDDETRSLIDANVGVLHIRSVYDFDGEDITEGNLLALSNPVNVPAADRPIRFVRIEKPVSLPNDDLVDIPNTAFGRTRNELMREIVGYAPVHPDGSVVVRVPANVPFAISLLDGDGHRISERHRNWVQLRPGETRNCNGCHASDSEAPHGRPEAEAPSINLGGPFSGLAFDVESGESMAEAWRRLNGAPEPDMNLVFEDVWTDPAQRTPDDMFELRFQDLETEAPLRSACLTDWQASCRITVHYDAHISPIWEVDRRIFDVDEVTVLEDRTCIACHTPVDDMGMAQIPEAQLDLRSVPSTDQADHLQGYRELLFNDVEREVVDGVLVPLMVPVFDNNGNQVFLLDPDGELVLDAEDNPIPITQTVNVNPTLSTNGANNSDRFFDLFVPGGTHAEYLSDAELKLISEWIDLGGQYYNDPFVVPQ